VRERDGALVFVGLRARGGAFPGGAAAGVGPAKRRRLVFAAQHFLLGLRAPPPCRVDGVAIEGERIEWLRAAFDRS